MKHDKNKNLTYTNKSNEFSVIPEIMPNVSDSCLVTDKYNTPLFKIDLTCFNPKLEQNQIAMFRSIITYLSEGGYI